MTTWLTLVDRGETVCRPTLRRVHEEWCESIDELLPDRGWAEERCAAIGHDLPDEDSSCRRCGGFPGQLPRRIKPGPLPKRRSVFNEAAYRKMRVRERTEFDAWLTKHDLFGQSVIEIDFTEQPYRITMHTTRGYPKFYRELSDPPTFVFNYC